MMMARLRHIPTVGESIEELGYRFVVEQANQRAIEKIRVETVE